MALRFRRAETWPHRQDCLARVVFIGRYRFGRTGLEPFDERVEETVMDGVYGVMKRVGRKPVKQ